MKMHKYSVVDLFSGAGGLSLGFLKTGKYAIKVAFENNPTMQDTYRLNHPGVEVKGDVCSADYSEIKRNYGKIDVVIGGPPCQGFSNANRQKNHIISHNNMLVKQYIRAIIELQPDGFVMENVSMLKSDVHRFFLTKNDEELINQYKIPTKPIKLCLIEKQYAFSEAFTIIQCPEMINELLWPETHYTELNVVLKYSNNQNKMQAALAKHQKKLSKIAGLHIVPDPKGHVQKVDSDAFKAIADYYAGRIEIGPLKQYITPAIMIQRMLLTTKEINENELVVDNYYKDGGLFAEIRSYAVYDYLKRILESEKYGYVINEGVLCAADYGAPQKRMRFVAIGVKRDISAGSYLPAPTFLEDGYRTVRNAIEDLEDVEPLTEVDQDVGIRLEAKEKLSELGKQLRDSEVLRNHIVTKTRETALARFKALKQGENFHALDDELKTNTYTDVSRTQNTIYLRLNYDAPSGTVINVRKSMWIHPTLDRAISVREAARLQTFPDSFVFCGSKDKQYQQVGNAVPPIMAEAIAEELAKSLEEGNCKGDSIG